MCLAVPMKLVKIENDRGIVELGGIKREISLGVIEKPRIGDYLIVHAGFAIQKLDEKEAKKNLEVLKELNEIQNLSSLKNELNEIL